MATFQKRGASWRAIIRRKGCPVLSKTFPKKSLAEAWAHKKEAELLAGVYNDAGAIRHITVADCIERYLQDIGAIKSIGRTKRSVLKALQLSPIGALSIVDLKASDVVHHCTLRLASVAPATINHDVQYLRGVIKVAKGVWGYPITSNAVDDSMESLTSLGLVGRSGQRERRPSGSELSQLKAFADANKRMKIPMSDIIDFAVASAMRLGEICRIEWSGLDQSNKTIQIVDRKDPRNKVGNNQRVPLLGESYEIVIRQSSASDRIFPYDPRSISAAFTRMCKQLGIVDLRFHDLRHEGVSRLFEQGYQIQEVAIVSGHRDWACLKRYTQLDPASLHR